MAIPSVNQRALLAAMRQFDRQLRDHRKWKNWDRKRNHKYAIVDGTHIYPVKKIISLATGMHVMDFHGGEGPGNANQYARDRKLDVQEIAKLKRKRGPKR